MSKVDEAIAEIDTALADMAPIHEGLRDYYLLDIHPDTKISVSAAIDLYDRRLSLLTTSRTALTNLVSDGYPVLVIPPVVAEVYADLQQNKATIDAALAKFAPIDEAATLAIVPGVPVNQ